MMLEGRKSHTRAANKDPKNTKEYTVTSLIHTFEQYLRRSAVLHSPAETHRSRDVLPPRNSPPQQRQERKDGKDIASRWRWGTNRRHFPNMRRNQSQSDVILIKGVMHQEAITTLNTCTPNTAHPVS